MTERQEGITSQATCATLAGAIEEFARRGFTEHLGVLVDAFGVSSDPDVSEFLKGVRIRTRKRSAPS